MAKGLRSKVKRHFRTLKRHTVSSAPTFLEKEQSKQDGLKSIIEAPKPDLPSLVAETTDTADAMAIDLDLPPLTTQNPAKLARKLKQRRLASSKGIKSGIKKKSKPLAGANQFHKKTKKNKR